MTDASDIEQLQSWL